MLEKILGALLPAVITILLGYFAARHHDFAQKEVPTLNKMVISYALPLYLFVGVVGAGRADLLADLPLALVLGIAIVGMYAAVFLLCRFGFHSPMGFSALGALAASAPSAAFVGAAVLGYFYGAKADIPVAIANIFIVLALVPATLIILSLETGEHESHAAPSAVEIGRRILAALKQPVVWLPLLGFAVVLIGVPVPEVIQSSLALLGHASAGVALFVSGIIIAGYRVVVNGPVLFLVFVKNILQPALVWGGMLWFGYTNPLLGEAVLTVALPAVVLSVMLSVEYKRAPREMASTLFISMLASMITIAGFITLLF